MAKRHTLAALIGAAISLLGPSACVWPEGDSRVFVSSDPQGAEVLLDGTPTGRTTPAELDLGGIMGGDHTILVRKRGYEPEERKVSHYTRFGTSRWLDGVADFSTPPNPLLWTFGDFFFPFDVRWAYVPHNLFVKLYPEGTFLAKPEATPSAEDAGAVTARAVLLDRDGVINRERGFVTRPSDLQVLPGVADALDTLRRLGYLRLIVTNQSGLARGLYSWTALHAIHRTLRTELPESIDGIYVCPHHPSEGTTPLTRSCRCRKPDIGLLEQARREHDLDLSRCWLVGDSERDIRAGDTAGLATILVLGPKVPAPEDYPEASPSPRAFVESLEEAVRYIEGTES